jgi:hypothetical protein
MKKLILLGALALAAAPAYSAKWEEGKLALSTSAMTDGYQTYKVALYMGDLGAVLWNGAGDFALRAGDPESGDSDRARLIARLIDFLREDCRQTQADFCSHQIPVRYRRETCTADHVPCLGIDFPLDPAKGLEGRHKLVWIVTPIRPAAEVRADNSPTCVASRYYDCR